ncbi:MAG: hypothetical protein AAGA83_03890 [Cyanobacteria bacterium P01_F01_bin.116]
MMSVKPLAKSSKPIKFPTSKGSRRGLGLLIILSVAFHGGLLLLPMPQWWLRSAEPEPEIDVEELEQSGAISLTRLPVAAPEPEVIEPLEPKIEAPEPLILTEVPDNLPEEVLEEVPAEDLETPENPEIPDVDNEAPLDSSTEDNEPELGIAVRFDQDFTHVDGAEAGCYGLNNCHMVSDKNVDEVSNDLISKYENRGYQLELYEDPTVDRDRSHKIYTMYSIDDHNAPPQYLNILVEGIKTITYLVTQDIIDREKLKGLTAEP